jgi:anaerobic magnesium-protoporphyrin IX monomethyl ester cyclase
VWVDESWNIDPRFNEAFADEVLRRGLKLSWFAFMRADSLLRDEKRGILEKLVASGLSHILIGVERAEDDGLGLLDKRFYQGGTAQKALALFKRKYPQVFLQATFIVGVREETPESIQKQVALAKEIDVDFPAFHPITPVPGTPVYDEAIRNKWITEDQFDDFDWLTPVLDSKFMSRHEIADALYDMNKQFVNPKWMLRGLFNRTPYKRDMYIWFTKVSAMMAWGAMKQKINPFDVSHYQQLVTPDWYDG